MGLQGLTVGLLQYDVRARPGTRDAMSKLLRKQGSAAPLDTGAAETATGIEGRGGGNLSTCCTK